MVSGRTADPWDIAEDEFPSTGRTGEQLRFMLRYAVLAPSGHNTQPWLYKIVGDWIELHADRTRALPVVDPEDRELTISCGATLFHLKTAIRYFGFAGMIQTLPDPANPDFFARIALGTRQPVTDEEQMLFCAITRRRTNRMSFPARAVPGAVLSALEAAARQEGAWFQLLESDDSRNRLADLIADGDRTQAADPRFRRELAAWLRPNRSRSHDGIPGSAFGFGQLFSYLAPLVIRTFDWGQGQAAKDRQLATGSPVIAIIGTAEDTPAAWLAAGQALARVLLKARAEDVWASFLNQPIEVVALRPRVTALARREGFSQLVLRLGYGPDVQPTPRRLPNEVLMS